MTGSGATASRPRSADSSSTTAALVTAAPASSSSRAARRESAARGEHVVDDHHVAPGELDPFGWESPTWRIRIRAVYVSLNTGGGSFPPLRTASTPVPSRVATAAAEDETPGVHTGDQLCTRGDFGQRIRHRSQSVGIGQQRREVLELDAG